MNERIRPNKRLSQNFLRQPEFAARLADSLDLRPEDTVCEIGCGEGVLTEYLLKSPVGGLIGVEIDKRLIDGLTERFGGDPRFTLRQQDFLKTRLDELVPSGEKLRVAGNLPYHITSPILFHVWDNREIVRDLTVMVQAEVAERLTSAEGSKAYGIPSVLFQAMADLELLFHVPRWAFSPVPAVDSAVVSIRFKQDVSVKDMALFKTVVKTSFGQRRKMLRNTLGRWAEEHEIEKVPMNLTRRPESLAVEEWIELANAFAEELRCRS
jgi:16S rRNA (adenine1518-N6/adenine1519-N6)-dimethyltransferase